MFPNLQFTNEERNKWKYHYLYTEEGDYSTCFSQYKSQTLKTKTLNKERISKVGREKRVIIKQGGILNNNINRFLIRSFGGQKTLGEYTQKSARRKKTINQ